MRWSKEAGSSPKQIRDEFQLWISNSLTLGDKDKMLFNLSPMPEAIIALFRKFLKINSLFFSKMSFSLQK